MREMRILNGGIPRFSRRVFPAYSFRNSTRRCSSGTSSSRISRRVNGLIDAPSTNPSHAPVVYHSSITSAI